MYPHIPPHLRLVFDGVLAACTSGLPTFAAAIWCVIAQLQTIQTVKPSTVTVLRHSQRVCSGPTPVHLSCPQVATSHLGVCMQTNERIASAFPEGFRNTGSGAN